MTTTRSASAFRPTSRPCVPIVGCPTTKKASLDLTGSVRSLGQGSTGRGYNVEALIPWSVFGLDGRSIGIGDRFGFNLSVNDNDSDLPAQETVLSLSPVRTTHDDPTEWATLVLTPKATSRK